MIGFFDLETLKLDHEVGGWEFASDMGLSVACLYVNENRAFQVYVGPDDARKGAGCYEGQDDTEQLVRELSELELIVGYNIKGFDFKVLQPYAAKHGVKLDMLPTFDMLLALGNSVGRPFPASLESLSTVNLGKIGHKIVEPKSVVDMYRKGLIDEVILYCMHDVWATRMLFQLAYETDELQMRTRRGTFDTVDVSDWKPEIHRIYGANNIVF